MSASSDGPESESSNRAIGLLTEQGRRFRNISMATWLSLVVLAVTITSLVVTSVVSLTYGSSLADGLIADQFDSRLALKADEVQRYMRDIDRRVAALSSNPGTVDMIEALIAGFDELDTPPETADETVAEWYQEEFVPLAVDRGATVSAIQLMPRSDEGVTLQNLYVVAPDTPEDARNVGDAGDGSAWSAAHAVIHPTLLSVADRAGFADLMLVDGRTGDVVYTVAKRPDLGTNLDAGPYASTTVAAMVRRIRADPVPGSVTTTDISPYMPAFMEPTGFVGAPVFDDNAFIGVLVAAYDTRALDSIMTSDGEWVDEGFGETGEAFLVASDGRMRSVSRQFVESPAEYLATVEAAGTATASERASMSAVGTTVNFQRVADIGTLADVDSGPRDPVELNSYLNVPVFAQVLRLDIPGVDWFAATQVGQGEIEAPLNQFRDAVQVAVALFVVVITFLTVAWASRLFQPVRSISERLRRMHDGDPDLEIEMSSRTPQDFVDLASHIDGMIDSLQRREAEVAAAASQRVETLRALLPTAVSRRVEDGDRSVLDHIVQASVVVLVVDGLGGLVRRSTLDASREVLDRLVAELDELAGRHGLERVKLVGDAYFAGCGITHPYLDHGPRTVAFALEARDLVESLGADASLRVSAGIDSGDLNIGLAGSSRLVYDLWGPPVTAAHSMARAAHPGEILVSESTHDLLPPDAVMVQRGDGDGPSVWMVDDLAGAGAGEQV